jgi:hypothetical protein
VFPKSMASRPGKCGIGRSNKNNNKKRPPRSVIDVIDVAKTRDISFLFLHTFSVGNQVLDGQIHVLLGHGYEGQRHTALSLRDP